MKFKLWFAGKMLARAAKRSGAMKAFPKLFGYVGILASVLGALAEQAQILPPTIGKYIVMASTMLAAFSHSIPSAAMAAIKLPSWFSTLASVLSVAAGFGFGGPVGLGIGVLSTIIAAMSHNVVKPTPAP
ncbi:MAG TPA: hypothetical protein VJL07_02805 [Dehalococcoidia bacterium]|nr:hypothetical protein [Dehalococcoidia bacterium]